MLREFEVKKQKRTAAGIDYEIEFISLEDTCCAVYLNAKSEILMVKQFRPILGLYTIEIPGGTKHKEETAEDAAKREFREETGLTVKNLEFLVSFYLSVGTSDEKVHIYLVNEVEEEAPLSSEEKGVVPLWVGKSQWLSMMGSGEIVDAKSIIALQRAFIS